MTSHFPDSSLLEKYNIPGPRYTSYPTAPHFTADADFDAIAATFDEESSAPLSAYFHIPYCESMCWFCACSNVVNTRRGCSAEYIELLRRELGARCGARGRKLEAAQLHWGGGSPSFLLPDEMRSLGAVIDEFFTLSPGADAGIEFDPRDMVDGHAETLREIGFNRVSFGVQDNAPAVQAAVNRIQPFEMTAAAVEAFRAAGFGSVNVDLIYGLPLQTPESYSRTLDEVISLSPDRLAVFNFAYVPWMKASQKIIKEESLPSPEMKVRLLQIAVEKLTSAGYVYIGMDHFAKADDELAVAQREGRLSRNFQGYSPYAGDVILGLGATSISQCAGAFLQNEKSLPRYTELVSSGSAPFVKGFVLSPDDRIRRRVIMKLMCDLRLDFASLSSRLGIDFEEYFRTELDALPAFEADGLLTCDGGSVTITPQGRFFLRNIAMVFDAYLEKGKGRYSKTV